MKVAPMKVAPMKVAPLKGPKLEPKSPQRSLASSSVPGGPAAPVVEAPAAVTTPSKRKTEDQQIRADCVTKLRRAASGAFSKMDDAEKVECKKALEAYQALPCDAEKLAFAKKFKAGPSPCDLLKT